MLRTSDSDTEILLGNKQLLGIFFVVAVLLGLAFTGGYMVGRDSTGKKVANGRLTQKQPAPSVDSTATGGETISVSPDSGETGRGGDQNPSAVATSGSKPTKSTSRPNGPEPEPPLGSPERKRFEQTHPSDTDSTAATPANGFTPETGQRFLQVGAVVRDEAEAIADVLHKKGFRAHAVPKPDNPKIYRVLIGPIEDAADLSTTRDSLRKTGFREVIVQKY